MNSLLGYLSFQQLPFQSTVYLSQRKMSFYTTENNEHVGVIILPLIYKIFEMTKGIN